MPKKNKQKKEQQINASRLLQRSRLTKFALYNWFVLSDTFIMTMFLKHEVVRIYSPSLRIDVCFTGIVEKEKKKISLSHLMRFKAYLSLSLSSTIVINLTEINGDGTSVSHYQLWPCDDDDDNDDDDDDDDDKDQVCRAMHRGRVLLTRLLICSSGRGFFSFFLQTSV